MAANFDQHQEGLLEAFQSIKTGLSLRQRSLSLMSIWYLGRAINDPRIINFIAKELTLLDVSQDPGLRLILQTTLASLSQNQAIRSHLRKSILPKVTDADQLAVLLGIHQGDRDLLQQLYGVDISQQKRE